MSAAILHSGTDKRLLTAFVWIKLQRWIHTLTVTGWTKISMVLYCGSEHQGTGVPATSVTDGQKTQFFQNCQCAICKNTIVKRNSPPVLSYVEKSFIHCSYLLDSEYPPRSKCQWSFWLFVIEEDNLSKWKNLIHLEIILPNNWLISVFLLILVFGLCTKPL